ncbi:MAG: SusC/RagA family TonB-linked outer membrane protein [Bacteroidetes bacterium]|nr:SusC/RagA family TonB-linked outer membrane protein [Bacteroidota bacterium]MCL6103744.1 SusC/RagA family TonB-linked outer membrane protein [Bacteroidota bacterium]
MKKRYIQILIFLSFVLLLSSTKVTAQKQKKENTSTIESVVKDRNGNPIKGATIYGNEGAVVAKTDASGKFTIIVSGKTDLLIESDGYDPAIYRSGEYNNLKEFSLKASLFLYSEKDAINVAFGKAKRGDLVNAVSVLEPTDILKYDNIQSVTGALSGRVPGLLGGSNIRGIGNALFIVDGLPRDINTINLAEVDQITVLKDINSSILYGNASVNGVVLITTKRGQAYKKQVNVSGFYGVSTPTALPEYLSSADYMELYNEAKINDGLAPQYDAATIANYTYGNPYRYPNVDYYSKEYLKDVKPFSRIMTELSGGNDVATYYSNLGWDQTGSLLNFGEGKSAIQNRFNVRGNVDLKINYWIKSSLDAVAVLNNNKGPVGNYWGEASTRQPNLFAPLIPISLIDPDNALLKGRKNDVNGMYLLGGTSSYLTNAFANGYSGGVNENIQRTFSFNNRIDFDLKRFVKGLAFHTNVSFDFYTRYDQAVDNSYAVYTPIWNVAADSIASLTKYGIDTRSGTQNVGNPSYQRRFGFYGMFDYDRTFGGVHHISGSLLGYGNRYKAQGDFQGNKNLNLGLRLGYIYKNKYMLDFSSAYVNSVKLPVGNRGAFSPSLGLAWVISSEDFMSSVSSVNYLKLRLSGGQMNSDAGIDGFFYYDNIYANSGGYSWYEGTWSNSGTVSRYGGNSQLAFEKRKEINFGFEGLFFDHQLSVDANVFTSEYFDQITRPQTQYSSFYYDYIPYQNFNSNSYKGAELGLSYNRSFGDFSFVIGANALYATSKVVKRDEIFANQYQYRTGRPIDARFGLVADGFFMDANDIANHAIQAFGIVKPGDIKYVDQNHDGVIDANDEVQIGRWQAPFSYGLNLKISYKNFTLFALGTGSIGADGYLNNNYYRGDGNNKYSEYILNRWTEATKTTATSPRLSSLANTNNYYLSTFWQYRNNYFTVNRMQLTYEMPEKVAKMLKMENLTFHVDASNLLTFSKYKNYRELNIGSEPQYRSFSLGVKTMF